MSLIDHCAHDGCNAACRSQERAEERAFSDKKEKKISFRKGKHNVRHPWKVVVFFVLRLVFQRKSFCNMDLFKSVTFNLLIIFGYFVNENAYGV
ncbi:hypothetical protein [Gluconobacter thailandicus]|uniref:hypothetical protein n=1 Tax=Gluconobacter thailandicus TaxID=257438 RepID=UPI001F3C1567|nr:hypothetical protein [Gluconobacter thailandicus]